MARREVYSVVHTHVVRNAEDATKEEEEILAEIRGLVSESGDGLRRDDFAIVRRRIANGEKDRKVSWNPKNSNVFWQ